MYVILIMIVCTHSGLIDVAMSVPYLHYEWTDLVYIAREKLSCYLQEIINPSNTTAYIVFGWCILGVDILSTHCKWTHWTDCYNYGYQDGISHQFLVLVCSSLPPFECWDMYRPQ